MTSDQITGIVTRISLFVASLWTVLQVVAFLLHGPARLIAFGVVLLGFSACIVLAAWAWMLRKLWMLSGVAASAMLAMRTKRSTHVAPAEGESEVRE